jgi:hypothetical protein
VDREWEGWERIERERWAGERMSSVRREEIGGRSELSCWAEGGGECRPLGMLRVGRSLREGADVEGCGALLLDVLAVDEEEEGSLADAAEVEPEPTLSGETEDIGEAIDEGNGGRDAESIGEGRKGISTGERMAMS